MELDVTVVIPILVGALLVVVGSLLGKVRTNWFVCIKTPWTLTSKLSWIKTGRLGEWLLVVIMGLTFIGVGLTGLAGSAWARIALLAIVAVCIF
ncbi:MAG TPA: SdpI family protein [Rubrobacteraceae bacterium]|nr:SdpI family protein [Rubrobacteraceae bacterium]